MKDLHYTNTECLNLGDIGVAQHESMKPHGLWYSIGDEWEEWCTGNMPEWLDRMEYCHELHIDKSKILVINSASDLLRFKHKYRCMHMDLWLGINWAKVAQDYSGIEIQNYHTLKRMEDYLWNDIWIYGWDINSGCIWDFTIVKGFDTRPTNFDLMQISGKRAKLTCKYEYEHESATYMLDGRTALIFQYKEGKNYHFCVKKFHGTGMSGIILKKEDFQWRMERR